MSKLNVKTVAAFAGPGRLSDGNNLYLTAKSVSQKSWLFIYKSPTSGKQREMGLGYAGKGGVPLAEARDKADAGRKLIRAGRDPLDERLAELKRLEAELRVVPSFGEFADSYVATHRVTWKNEKHAAQWETTLQQHAAALRPKRLNEIGTEDILEVLKPIWDAKHETASRLRGRIERVLDAAKVKGLRDDENPARWRGHLEHLLSKRRKLTRGRQRALAWDRVPNFMADLRQREELGSRLLEFAILCVSRSAEARGATWAEINLTNRVWMIPAERMKGKKEHRVPLSNRAVEILELVKALKMDGCDLVFPSREGTALSDAVMTKTIALMGYKKETTQHGFRSAFSDWRAEATHFPYELAEMALAHKIANEVEAAYRRGDMFEKRRAIMQAWADHCEGTNTIALIRAA